MNLCMSKSAEILRNLYKKSGFSSYEALAKAMGRKTGSAIQRYFKDDARNKDWIDADVVEEFIVGFSKAPQPIPEADVWRLGGPNFMGQNPPNEDFINIKPLAKQPLSFETKMSQNNNENVTKTVYVYGPAAAGDPERIALTRDFIVEEIEAPVELEKVRDGFVMYVAGDSMRPKYRSGQMVSVHPYKRPEIEHDCVIVFKDEGNAILKEFAGETETDWKVRQYNPEKVYKIKKTEVRALYAVVGRPSP